MPKERSIEIVDALGVRVALLDENGLQDVNGNIYHQIHWFTVPLLVGSLSNYIWTNPSNNAIWRVAAVRTMVSVVGGAGATFMVRACTRTQAIASGTDQLSAAIDLTVAAPAPFNGLLVASPQDILPGDHLAAAFAGTLTGLVGVATIAMRRLK